MAIPAALIGLGKQILAKALYTKVTKELDRGIKNITKENEDNEVIEIVSTIEEAVISKKKVSAWSVVAISLVWFSSSQGWISPEIAQLVDTLLSNPEVVQSIESAVE